MDPLDPQALTDRLLAAEAQIADTSGMVVALTSQVAQIADTSGMVVALTSQVAALTTRLEAAEAQTAAHLAALKRIAGGFPPF
jgi:uncharacterized coiled-coil protein SlyX